eukprot:maker-scaffold619_size123246-snap-gene-0.35 protein:Tk05496 transcript:maker-scaffold619_size123246-snap-gene-0.35-mRNA-1 annotation:"PREDICTED: hemicentin-1-like"
MSHYVTLEVVVPAVEIESDVGDIHAQTGSQVRLTCAIRNTLHRPRFVNWYHGNQRITPNSETRIHTLKSAPPGHLASKSKKSDPHDDSVSQRHVQNETTASMESEASLETRGMGGDIPVGSGRTYLSVMTLQRVQPNQSGRYTCVPSSDVFQLPEAFVNLHIVKGETLAAKSERDRGEENGLVMNSASQASSASIRGHSWCVVASAPFSIHFIGLVLCHAMRSSLDFHEDLSIYSLLAWLISSVRRLIRSSPDNEPNLDVM